MRQSIPFIGPSEPWAKAGALYAFGWDFKDVGAQSAEIAAEILNGKKPSDIPAASARKMEYFVNLKAAEQLKVEVSEAVRKGSRKVFGGD
jgi:putative ABC transport system substrate-binding protein